MPIIEHGDIPLPAVVDYRRERLLVSSETGATSLTIKEVELHPGWEGRLHQHSIEVAIMVMAGALQVALGNEVRTIRAGYTLLAPPGVPHKLLNQLWIPVQLLVTYPSSQLDTDYLE
jgi:quercetin dioxygenase-like cupin family protein